MREWCSCGSSIRASRRDVLQWRTTHRHDNSSEPEQPHRDTESRVETAWREPAYSDGERRIPDVQARIGFTPNA